MRRLGAGIALLLAAPALAQTTDGRLEPELRLDGRPAAEACSFAAHGGARSFEAASGSGLSLPAGKYALRVECKVEGSTLVHPGPTVEITPGKTAAPVIEVRSARLRVEARRSGIMLPAKVHLIVEGGDGEPLQTLPANQRVVAAAGRYDLLVTLDDPRAPRAEVRLPQVKLTGSALQVVHADLSDGSLVTAVTANGKKAAGMVRVFAPEADKDLAMIDAGAELRLPAGRYRVVTELREAADFPSRRQEVWIRAGKATRLAESFETGQLSVAAQSDGRPVDATVRLSLAGVADFFNHFSAPGTVVLSPGSYDVSLISQALGPLPPQRQSVKLARGQAARVLFDLTPASLTVKVVKQGQPVEAAVHVRAPGGGEEVGAPDARGTIRLWPGRYEILAALEGGEEILDGPFEVKLAEKLTRVLQVTRATLVVQVMRGKRAAEGAEVLIHRPGAAKPTARGRAGARFELSPGVYDVKVVDGAETVWQQGVKLKTQQVVRVELKPDTGAQEALPEGDTGAPSEDLPEGDEPARSDAGTR